MRLVVYISPVFMLGKLLHLHDLRELYFTVQCYSLMELFSAVLLLQLLVCYFCREYINIGYNLYYKYYTCNTTLRIIVTYVKHVKVTCELL